MTESVKLGIPGLSVPQGTHMCAFFRGSDERDGIRWPFVREGLRSGDKCLCAVEATDRNAAHTQLNAEVDLASASDQLDIVLASDVYLGRGVFSVPEMLGFWDTWAAKSLAGGRFSFARAAGEITRAVAEVIGAANLVRYESKLNRFVARYPQVLMCLYDLDRFGGDLLVDILKTPPQGAHGFYRAGEPVLRPTRRIGC